MGPIAGHPAHLLAILHDIMRTIRGKLALVTGAAAGIGRALAGELARQGADLMLVDVNERGLARAAVEAAQFGGRVTIRVANLASSDEVSQIADLVHDKAGGLDILVNNAGVAYYGLTHQMADDQWQKVMAVNLLAPLQLTRQLLPLLLANDQAHVLNVCSIAGLVGVARLAAYNTSKFALVGFSESLRAEYGPRGLGVTALCPGLVRTGLFETAMTGGGKTVPRFPGWLMASPQRVARRGVRAIRKNQGTVVVSAGPRHLVGEAARAALFRSHATRPPPSPSDGPNRDETTRTAGIRHVASRRVTTSLPAIQPASARPV